MKKLCIITNKRNDVFNRLSETMPFLGATAVKKTPDTIESDLSLIPLAEVPFTDIVTMIKHDLSVIFADVAIYAHGKLITEIETPKQLSMF